MPDITLATEPRTELGSRPAGPLRREGKVPAVVYGLGNDPLADHRPGPRAAAHPRRRERRQHADQPRRRRRRRAHPRPPDPAPPHPGRAACTSTSSASAATSRSAPRSRSTSSARPTGVKDGGLLEQLVFNLTVEAMPGQHPRRRSSSTSSELAIGDQLHVVRHRAARRRRDPARPRHRRRAGRGTARRGRGRDRGRGRRGRRGRSGRGRRGAAGERPSGGDGGERASSRVLRRPESRPRQGTPADLLVVGLGQSGRRVRAHAPQRGCRDRRAPGQAPRRVAEEGQGARPRRRGAHRRRSASRWRCRSRT